MRGRDLGGRCAILAWEAGAWGMKSVVTDEKGGGAPPLAPPLLPMARYRVPLAGGLWEDLRDKGSSFKENAFARADLPEIQVLWHR